MLQQQKLKKRGLAVFHRAHPMESASDASPQVNRKRAAKKPPTAVEMCENCNSVPVEVPGVCFQLGCENDCRICGICFSKCQNDRQCSPIIQCPGCKMHCNKWRVQTEKKTSVRLRSGNLADQKEPVDDPQELKHDPVLDPVRHHMHLGGIIDINE